MRGRGERMTVRERIGRRGWGGWAMGLTFFLFRYSLPSAGGDRRRGEEGEKGRREEGNDCGGESGKTRLLATIVDFPIDNKKQIHRIYDIIS